MPVPTAELWDDFRPARPGCPIPALEVRDDFRHIDRLI